MKEMDENATLSSLFFSKVKKEEKGLGDSKMAKKAAKRKGYSKVAEAAKRSKKNEIDDGGERARKDNGSTGSSKDEKKKKKKFEKTEERVVSTYFPTNRIKRILKDETPDIRPTSDAVFLFNRATLQAGVSLASIVIISLG
ncbi:hypothetical protein ACLOJK_032706 [Asimina triloba]